MEVAFMSFPPNPVKVKRELFNARRKWVAEFFICCLLNSHVIPCITLLNCIFHCVIPRKNSFSHLNHKRRENCHFYMKNSFLFHPLLAIEEGRRKNSLDISLKKCAYFIYEFMISTVFNLSYIVQFIHSPSRVAARQENVLNLTSYFTRNIVNGVMVTDERSKVMKNVFAKKRLRTRSVAGIKFHFILEKCSWNMNF